MPFCYWVSATRWVLQRHTCDHLLDRLKKNFERRGPALFLLATGGVASDSHTAYVNGLVDWGEEMHCDKLGFLQKGRSDPVTETQRGGRILRVCDGIEVTLADDKKGERCPWVPPYAERLQVTLAAVALGIRDTPIGLSAAQHVEAKNDLARLAAVDRVADEIRLTTLGTQALKGDMDICASIMVQVSSTLGVKAHALVAARFISCGGELFADVVQSGKQATLSCLQVNLGVDAGFSSSGLSDIHTVVHLYLLFVAGGRRLPTHMASLLRMGCLHRMSAGLPEWTRSESQAMLDKTDWARALTVAIAFAYQKNILHVYGCTEYKSCFRAEDEVANSFGLDAGHECLQVSIRSLAHASYHASPPTWVVYVATGRKPYVKSVTVLPPNIAGWFTHHCVSWSTHSTKEYGRAFELMLQGPCEPSTLNTFLQHVHPGLPDPALPEAGSSADAPDTAPPGTMACPRVPHHVDQSRAEQSRARPCYSVVNPGQSNSASTTAAPSTPMPPEPEDPRKHDVADSPAAERARSQAGSQRQTDKSTTEHSRAQPWHIIARPDQSRSATTAAADGTAMPPEPDALSNDDDERNHASEGDEAEPIIRRGAWGHNSVLLSQVRDELRARESAGAEATSHCIHADDLARLVQRVRSEVSTEDCRMHADMLVGELERDEAHRFCDVVRRTRKDLANLMHILLAHQSLPQKRLRIKQVAYEVALQAHVACVAPTADAGAADAMTPSCLTQWLDPEHQASLVDQMLTQLSTGSQHSAAAAALADRVHNTDVRRGDNQDARVKAEKRMKKARQKLNWATGEVTFMTKHELDEALGLRQGGVAWENDCFGLELYDIGGRELTKAEAFSYWWNQGYSWPDVQRYFQSLQPRKLSQKRALDPAWRHGTKERLRGEALARLQQHRGHAPQRSRTPSPDRLWAPK